MSVDLLASLIGLAFMAVCTMAAGILVHARRGGP